MIEIAAVQELIGCWWLNYDEGNFDELAILLTDDMHFACRTDTGTTEYEEFVRADVRGRDAVMEWQRQHRLDSPYPLRHNATNIHLTRNEGAQAAFASYIFVTQIAGGVSNLSTAIVRGTVREVESRLRIADLEVTLDTMESEPFRAVRASA